MENHSADNYQFCEWLLASSVKEYYSATSGYALSFLKYSSLNNNFNWHLIHVNQVNNLDPEKCNQCLLND
jgi:hypothetical protein